MSKNGLFFRKSLETAKTLGAPPPTPPWPLAAGAPPPDPVLVYSYITATSKS